jgi:hypothetical protein
MNRYVSHIHCYFNWLYGFQAASAQDRALKHFIPLPYVFGKYGADILLVQLEKHYL